MEERSQSSNAPVGASQGVQPASTLDNSVAQNPPVATPAEVQPTPGFAPTPAAAIQESPELSFPQKIANYFGGFPYKMVGLGLLVTAILVGSALIAGHISTGRNTNNHVNNAVGSSNSAKGSFNAMELPLGQLANGSQLNIQSSHSLVINGQLDVNNSLILSPNGQPTNAVAGQLYFDQKTDELSYFNGGQFVNLLGSSQSNSAFNSSKGVINLGNGLTSSGGQIFNSGVLSLQGQAGQINLGSGLAMSGSTLSVTQSGNVSTGGTSGAAGNLAVFTGGQTLGNSLISQNGSAITVGGDLNVTGNVNLSNPLGVLQGGTGVSSLGNDDLVVGGGTGALSTIAASSAGQCLLSTNGAPQWVNCPGGTFSSLDGLAGNLTLADSTGSGTTVTIDTASNTQEGIASFNNTNLIVTTGQVDTVQDINPGSTPTFAGLNTNQISPSGTTLTVGAAGKTTTLQGGLTTTSQTNGGFTTSLGFQTPTANVTYLLQTTAAGTYNVCTTAGNCTGVGGGVTTAGGTINDIPKFTATQGIGNSELSDSGTVVTDTGGLTVQGTVTLTNALSVGNGGTGATSANVARSNLGAAASGANSDITSLSGLTTALSVLQGGTGTTSLTANGVLLGNGTGALSSLVAGSSNDCLVSTAGAPVWTTCPDTGVSLLDGLAGSLTIANSTGSGSTVTIQDASTSQLGLAEFNSTNFTVSSGIVNTAQNINTAATPTFATLNLTSSQASSAMLLVDNTNTGATGNLLDLQLNGSSKLHVDTSGNVTLNGTVNGQTISSAASLTGSLAVAGAANLDGGATVTGTLTANTITPTAPMTIGSSSQTLTIQGNGSTELTATSGGSTTTLGFQTPTANVSYVLQTAAAGTYNICTTVGNCSGVGGGVTTAGGTVGDLAVFTGSQVIGNSLISESGGTVTVNGNLNLTTGNQFQINGSQIASSNLSDSSNLAKLNATQTFTGGSNVFENGANSANAFVIENASANPGFNVNTSTGAITFGNITSTAANEIQGQLVLADGTADNFGLTLESATLTANQTITFPNLTGTVCIENSTACGFATSSGSGNYIDNTTTTQAANIDVQAALSGTVAATLEANASGSGDILDLENGSGGKVLTVGSTGSVLVHPSTNASNAFTVEYSGTNTDTNNIFNVDTIDSYTNAAGVLNIVGGETVNNLTATYVNEPMTVSPKGILLNDATYVSGQYVQLNPATNNTWGALQYNSINPGAYFTATWQQYIGGGGGADSTYFYWGSTSTPVNESSNTGGYMVYWDEHTSKIDLAYAGSTLDSVTQSGMNNSTWTNVEVTQSGSTITVYWNGTQEFSYTDLSRQLGGSLTGWGARSGGINDNHRVRNLLVVDNIPSPTVTPQGTTGSTDYTYEITAVTSQGGQSVPSAPTQITNGTGTLTGTNYNQISWSPIAGASSYNIYRTQGGTNQGLVGNTTSTSYNDTGYPGTSSPPSADTSGALTVNGGPLIVENTSGLNDLAVNGTTGALSLGNITSTSGDGVAGSAIFADGTADNFGLTVNTATLTANQSITFPNASGTVCLDNSVSCGFAASSGSGSYIQNGTSTQSANFNVQAASSGSVAAVLEANGSGTGDILDLENGSGVKVETVSSTGAVVDQNSANSAAAFVVENASGYNDLNVNSTTGLLSLGNITSTSGHGVQGAVAFADGTNDNFGLTVQSLTLTNNQTISFPNLSGTVCLEGSTACGFATSSGSGSYINDTTATQAANFNVQAASSGSVAGVLEANNTGTGDILDLENGSGAKVGSVAYAGATLFQNSVNSSNAFEIENAAGYNLLNINSTTGLLSLGNITSTSGQGVAGQLSLADGTNDNFGLTVESTTLTANQTITFPNLTGTVCLESSSACGFAPSTGSGNYIQNGTSTQSANFNVQAASSGSVAAVLEANGSGTGDILDLENGSGGKVATFGYNGIVTFQNSANSTNALQVETSGGSPTTVFNVDTANDRVGIGTNAPSSALTVNNAGANSQPGLIVQGASGQSGNLLNFQDSNGNVLSHVDSNGNYYGVGTITTVGVLHAPSGMSATAASGSGLVSSTKYYYEVTSTNVDGETEGSSTVNATTGAGVNDQITVSWSAVSGATGYKVYMNTSNSFTSGSLLLATISGGSTNSYIDSTTTTSAGFPPSSPPAVNGLCVQNFSGSCSFYVNQYGNSDSAAGMTVSGQTGSNNQASNLLVQESGNIAGEVLEGSSTVAAIQIQDSGNGDTLSQFSSSGAYTSYGTNTSLLGLATPAFTTSSTGTSFYYVITATNSAGETLQSASLGMANDTSALAWSVIPGATGYKIYRNSSNNFTSGARLLKTVTSGQTTSYTDTGSATTTGLPPTAPAGTSLIVQGWGGQSNALAEFENSAGTTVGSIGATGNTLFENSANSANAFQVENASGYNDLNVNSTTGALTLGNVTSTSGAGVQGSIVLADGTNDNFGLTMQSTTLTANQTITFPNSSGTVCLISGTACGFILNQTSQQAGSNFNISGTGIAGVEIETPLLDTASSGILSIGTTNATAIDLNQNTVVASNKTFQVQGYAAIGNNATPNSSYALTVDDTINPTGNSYGVSDILRLNPSGTDANYHSGIFGEAQTLSGNNQNFTGGLRGVTFFVQNNGTGTVAQGWGGDFYVENSGNGIITDARGIEIGSATNSGSGSITTNYGLKIDDQTAGTTNYAIYTGLGAVRFGDNTTIASNKSFTADGSVLLEDATSNGSALKVENSSGNLVLGVNTSTGATSFGNVTSTSGAGVQGSAIFADGTNDNFGLTVESTTLTANQTITFPNMTGTVCLSSGNCSGLGSYIVNGTSTQSGNFNVQASISGSVAGVLEANASGSGDILDLENGSGVKVATVGSTGASAFENSANSTNAFQIENSSGDSLLNLDTTSTSTNLVTNPSFESGTTGWLAKGSATISQSNTQALFGNDSLKIATTAAANDGAEYAYNLASGTQYTLTMYVRDSSGSLNTIELGRSENGSTNTTCMTGGLSYATQWYLITCTFTTGTTSGSTYVYVDQSDAVSRTLYIDDVQLAAAASTPVYEEGHTTLDSNVYINGNYNQASTSNNALTVGAMTGGNGLVVLGAPNANVSHNAFDVENNTFSYSFFHVSDTFDETVVNGGSNFYNTPALDVNTTIANAVAMQVGGASGQSSNLVNYTDNHNDTLSAINANGGFISYGTNNSMLDLTSPVFTTSSSGSSYYYEITATNAAGETLPSASLGMANNTSALAWNQVTGATGYKIYRNTSNSFTSGSLLLTTITNGSTASYTDTGSATTAGLPPTAPAGTTLTLQAWGGQTANSLAFENSGGSTIAAITAGGNIDTASAFDTLTNTALNIGNANATSINIGNSGASNVNTLYGTTVIQTLHANSTTAFQVENTGNTSFLTVDTTNNGSVAVGTNTETHTAQLYVESTAIGQKTVVLQAMSGQTADLLDLYNTSGSYAGGYDKNGNLYDYASATFADATNSTTAFNIENSGGSAALLTADTTNMRLGIDASETSMGVPTGLSIGTATSGGSLAALTTYYYKVTAIDSAGGETTASTEASGATTSSNLTLPVSWTAVTGASGYRIYRATSSGSEVYLTTVASPSFTDMGSQIPSTATPPGSNTAYVSSALSNNALQTLIGGLGTPTAQQYVSGTLPSGAAGNFSNGSGSQPQSIVTQGNYAYVIDNGTNTLQIIDISNPTAPVSMSTYVVGNNPHYAVVSGQYAYIANYGSNNIQIINISDPSSPTSISTTSTGTGSRPTGLYVQGKYLYVVYNATAQLQVFDISNPAAPIGLGTVSTDTNPRYVFAEGNFVYVASNGSSKLDAFNVSNPNNPLLVGSVSTGSTSNAFQVYVQGRYAYVTTENTNHSNLEVIDISNPYTPIVAGTLAIGSGTQPQGVYVHGRYAYVVNMGTNTMQIIDVSNPYQPVSDGTVTTGSSSTPFDIAVNGRYAYVTNPGTNNTMIYDLGGSYIQQLQAGGVEAGSLQVDANASIGGDQSIEGGLTVGTSLQVSGNASVGGSAFIQGALNVAGGIQGGATINGLSTPSAPTITQQGTSGSTDYTYAVAAISSSGGITPASATTQTTTGAATLTGTNYNTVSWSPVTGAVSYDVYRTASSGSPSTTGLIGTTTNTYFNDTGLGGSGSAPTTDSSGQLTTNGFATFKNTTNSTTSFQVQNQSGVNLLTANTTDSYVVVGSSSSNSNAVLLVLNNYNNSTDPSGTNGAMYYNASIGQFRCEEQGHWYNCVGSSTDLQRQMPVYSSDFIGLNDDQTAPFNPSGQGSGSDAMDTGDETGNHFGVIDFHGGSSAGGGYNLMTNWSAFVLGGGNGFETVIEPHSFSGVEERFGYFDNNGNAAINNGAWVDVNSSGVATGMTSNSGTQSSTGSTYTMSTATWYRVKVQVNSNATQVDYYIYNDSGTQLWHDSLTTNIPTGTTGCGDAAETSTTSSLHIVGDDYEAFWVNEPLTR